MSTRIHRLRTQIMHRYQNNLIILLTINSIIRSSILNRKRRLPRNPRHRAQNITLPIPTSTIIKTFARDRNIAEALGVFVVGVVPTIAGRMRSRAEGGGEHADEEDAEGGHAGAHHPDADFEEGPF